MPESIESYRDFAAWRESGVVHAPLLASKRHWPGHCITCGSSSGFRIAWTNRRPPDSLRESLACINCGSNARQRAATSAMIRELASARRPRIYLTEQASPLFIALHRRYPGLAGSEFQPSLAKRLKLSAWLWRQRVWTWVRHRDATALAFGDASLDAIVCLDVLEHVPDFRAALREFARVLKPGGALLLTVPWYWDRAESREIARIRADGGIEHLQQPPEYHGDPLGGGVLCFHHFGWDLLEAMRDCGFAEAEALRVSDPGHGLPEAQWVLRARR
ncbi:MAG: class I SAM-dependent methyltransferase [Thermomonas sp.]